MGTQEEISLSKPRNFLKAIKRNPAEFYVIHYSCQSLYDDNAQLSPRITSIVVANYGSGEEISFSTHAVAEELGISRQDVEANFSRIELRLLEAFNDFVRGRRDKYWVHWNMRNLTYGFEHIAHRYKALGGAREVEIPIERRLNLNDLLARHFGKGYAKHPKLHSLMEMNGGIHRYFLTGAEEVTAFANREFIRMYNSTQCKVGFLLLVMRRWSAGRLRTDSRGFGITLDRAYESRVVKVVTLLGSIVGVLATVAQFI